MRIRLLLVLLFLFVFVAGCHSEKDPDKNSGKNENEQAEQSGQSEHDQVYPLTGEKTNGETFKRPVGVMVNNHPKARPQTGLSQADMVFEILAEGRITRFLALFQSNVPDVVGPVRSAREYFFELADGYHSVYVHHGAANFVDDRMKERGIERIDGANYDNDGILFKRASYRHSPHNSYLQFDAVYDMAEEKGYDTSEQEAPLPFLQKDEADKLSGDSAQHVRIDYSFRDIMNVVDFDYDEGNEQYSRFSDDEQTVELDTDKPIQVDNVLIMETTHKVFDDAGRRKIDLESGGDALLLQKGQVQHVQWENKNGRIVPVKNGESAGFVRGKTWINVIPENPGLGETVTILK